ncbi:MAG: methyltransferase domain-containing protein [Gammaproteobacteria bacterium]|nr:MAG: methyltransferase domain-containing protein [Gammaproteobacteria bacterium]
MQETARSAVDPLWEEEIYGREQQLNRYPFDFVVTFVHRFRDRTKTPEETSILEVGCGAGNNLWFAAREGFRVAGLDGSPSAIGHAAARFRADGLSGEFCVGDFTSLPYPDATFDLVIDRGSLTNCGFSAAGRAVAEIQRVLRPGGRFLFNPYSRAHTSHLTGTPGPDELTVRITGGVLRQYRQICFYDEAMVRRQLGAGWKLLSLRHLELREHLDDEPDVHAEWRVVAEKA